MRYYGIEVENSKNGESFIICVKSEQERTPQEIGEVLKPDMARLGCDTMTACDPLSYEDVRKVYDEDMIDKLPMI